MIDSEVFGHQWTTAEGRVIFDEPARVRRWVRVIIALARAQAACGIIPTETLPAIEGLAQTDLPISDIARQTRATSHSTLGMIHVLRDHLPEDVREYVYYGTTVQDITDTSQVLEMQAVARLIWRDLWVTEGQLLALAEQHRTTPMVGRTHGQPGSPISFGLKAAVWADEVGRHLQRLQQAHSRLFVGQLGGAVGSLGFFRDKAMPLRAQFCNELNLVEPDISWINARDRFCEFAQLLAMITATLAKIANETFTLQRKEIGELAERTNPNTVGSITMPHKRNPESSEQIVALSKLVRADAGVMTETMLQENERDARSWKVEWAVFPELCQYSLAAAAMTRDLVEGLEVNVDAMRRNLLLESASEGVLATLSEKLGKHSAQAVLQDAYRKVREEGVTIPQALSDLVEGFVPDKDPKIDIGASAQMVDRVLARANSRRSDESEAAF
ncbi:adenylosuccinate lyase family protein [Ruegeria sp. THAF57]|uniref:class-II fumarase/aspartase family protein n=1 Tax=Ruegeria sp. THAF57 TaxID=2744555 RepID=UPI0015DFBF35|nr:adenylosuccinate lyase family protein [Ruegeria sp. THAF57]